VLSRMLLTIAAETPKFFARASVLDMSLPLGSVPFCGAAGAELASGVTGGAADVEAGAAGGGIEPGGGGGGGGPKTGGP
jgi:hypothetical protein